MTEPRNREQRSDQAILSVPAIALPPAAMVDPLADALRGEAKTPAEPSPAALPPYENPGAEPETDREIERRSGRG